MTEVDKIQALVLVCVILSKPPLQTLVKVQSTWWHKGLYWSKCSPLSDILTTIGIFIEVNQVCNICQQRACAGSHTRKAGGDKLAPESKQGDKYLASEQFKYMLGCRSRHRSKHRGCAGLYLEIRGHRDKSVQVFIVTHTSFLWKSILFVNKQSPYFQLKVTTPW